MTRSIQALPAPLRAQVRVVQAELGEVVAVAEGPRLFAAVEGVRREMVAFREAGDRTGRGRALERAGKIVGALGPGERTAFARAYTLYLELVNVCENAYRTHRLRQQHRRAPAGESAQVVYVLTAHPTESRAPRNIRVLRRVQELLVGALERNEPPDQQALRHLLELLWRVGTHPRHKPSVEDEARHLFSLLDDAILDEVLDLAGRGHRVRFRTWVGGDKDGHPGVGPKETACSLQLSRERLLAFARERLMRGLAEDMALLDRAGGVRGLDGLRRALDALARVDVGDGDRVAACRSATRSLQRVWRRHVGRAHPLLERLDTLFELFPGLVIPLELREERGLFAIDAPIASMLRYLTGVARGGRIEHYVAGVVVSMAGRPEDLLEALRLVRLVTGGTRVPVVPLFELPEVLERASAIVAETWKAPEFRRAVRAQGGAVEVMLGYSDTAKRMGPLASRLAIGRAMGALGRWGRETGVRVSFFHGSGGSVGRGGGTLADRASGWPSDCLVPHKETLQGEMVERSLASPEILRSNVEKVAAIQAHPPRRRPPGTLARQLAEESHRAFVDLSRHPSFGALIGQVTPYELLDLLTIGSRPSRRRRQAGLESLRAIPWVLCWTQTRLLLHAWLGLGTAWRRMRREPGAVARLRRELRTSPFLRSQLRLLGFTLAKTSPRVWETYVERLGHGIDPALVRRLERERRDALDLARRASPDGELLHDRPWLLESIRHRAPMIHPLNLLQIDALERAARGKLKREDELLFRETVTGIAVGMLTTG